ncbi:unnamed protein product [Rhodiola kirilowii]
MSPFRLVYRKTCHLPLKLEYKEMWDIRKLIMDPKTIGEKRHCSSTSSMRLDKTFTRMLVATRRERRNGLTRESCTKNKRKASEFFSITLASDYFLGSCAPNGVDHAQ